MGGYLVGPYANLVGANLTNADLSSANLTNATYNASTVFPSGFDPVSEGMTLLP